MFMQEEDDYIDPIITETIPDMNRKSTFDESGYFFRGEFDDPSFEEDYKDEALYN